MDVQRLKKLLDDEDKFLRGHDYAHFWEDYELGLLKHEARELLNLHMIDKVFRSNSTTGYKCNRENIVSYLEQQDRVNEIFKPEQGIPDDLFKTIVNYDDVKAHFRAILDQPVAVGVLLIGPPASAKSMFLLELSRLPRSRYVTASSTTKSGLTDILLDYEPEYLMVDELDKGSARDYDTLLSLLQSGIVQRNQHNLNVQKVLRTKVFAACNRDNRIPPEIMSRFIQLRFKQYTTDEMRDIGMAILIMHEHLGAETAHLIVTDVLDRIGTVDPRDFLKVARLRTGDSPKDIQGTVDFVLKYR